MQRSVGIIGFGLMGTALAQRLTAAGFDFAGYDVDAAKTAQITELGGKAAQSIAEIARECDPIVLAVFSTDQVEEVVEKHLLPVLGDHAGRIVLCASTCDPDRIAALGVRVAARGLRFLETPVSGTSAQVARGEGVGLIGGDPTIAAEIEPVLRALFPTYFLIGKVGDGGRAKLAVNLILGLNRLALAEGLAFAERLGLDPAAFLDVARALCRLFADHGHQGRPHGAPRVRARGARPADAEGRATDVRAGAYGRAGAAAAQGACRGAGSLSARGRGRFGQQRGHRGNSPAAQGMTSPLIPARARA